jgi:two-component sensor histidine kinase
MNGDERLLQGQAPLVHGAEANDTPENVETERRAVMLDTTKARVADTIEPCQANDSLELIEDESLLLGEAHHRMKNTLALLVMLLHRDFRPSSSLDVSCAVTQFERRVVAFGELYRLLSIGWEHDQVPLGTYLRDLCNSIASAILEPLGLRCEVAVEDGFIAARRCERLGLIVLELVTNAVKHAFPGRADGLIYVGAVHRGGCWRLTVSDNGAGSSAPPLGAGTRIVQELARSIRARLFVETGRSGAKVIVVAPD